MTIVIAILTLSFPIIFQVIYGRKAFFKYIDLKFVFVCLLSFILQLFFTCLSFFVTMSALSHKGYKSVTGPVAGIIAISLTLTLLMTLVMIIQILWHNFNNKNTRIANKPNG